MPYLSDKDDQKTPGAGLDAFNREFYGDSYEPVSAVEKESSRLAGIDQANKRKSLDSFNRELYGETYTPASDAEIESAREEELRRTVPVSAEDIDAEPPVGQEGFFGGIEEMGRGLARTVNVAVPEMVGKAAEYFDPEGGSTALRDWGVEAQEGAKEWLQENPEYKQSLTAQAKKQEDPYSVHGSAGEATEMLGPSLAGPVGGAAIGAVIGGALGTVVAPGLGTAGGAAIGAKAGAWAGGAASLVGFFGSAALDTEKKVLKANIKPGMTPEQIAEETSKAKTAGLLAGGLEAGGEAVSKIPIFQMLRFVPKSVKTNAVNAATKVVKNPMASVKDLLKVVGAEVGTEVAQTAGQQAVEHAYGAGEAPTVESVEGVIMPTIIMSALTWGLAEPVGMVQRQRLTRDLSDPAAPVETRVAAVQSVADTIKDEEVKEMWLSHALPQIERGHPVVLADDVFYSDEASRRALEGQAPPSVPGAAPEAPTGAVVEPAAPETPTGAPVVSEEGVVEPADATIAPEEGVVAPEQGVVEPADATIAPEEGVVAPADATVQGTPLEVGSPHRAMGADTTVIASQVDEDNVRHDLYEESGDVEKPRGFVRTIDIDSGETVHLRSFPDMDAARRVYDADIKAPPPAEPVDSDRRGRRVDAELRARWDTLSPEQQFEEAQRSRVEARTSHVSGGLPNKLAYSEVEKKPVQVFLDADSLKYINDNVGHEAGDALLKAIGDVLKRHTSDAFHLSGDEFALQASTEAEAEGVMGKVRSDLENLQLVGEKDGHTYTYNPGVSYGKGKTLSDAEAGLQPDKERRELEGKRSARGEKPPSLVERTAEGREVKSQREEKEIEKQARLERHIKAVSNSNSIAEVNAAVKQSTKEEVLDSGERQAVVDAAAERKREIKIKALPDATVATMQRALKDNDKALAKKTLPTAPLRATFERMQSGGLIKDISVAEGPAEGTFFAEEIDPGTVEQHHALSDPDTMEALRTMAANAGWAERGGGKMRDNKRMPWIPLQEWFARKPDGVTEKHFKGAIERLDADTKLTKPQRAAVVFMLEELNDAKMSDINSDVRIETEGESLQDIANRLDALEDGLGEDIFERGATQDLRDDVIREQLLSAISAREYVDFDLSQQTEAEAAAVEATIKAQRKAEEEADKRHRADLERDGFVLSGSSRDVDEREARGQRAMFSVKKGGPKNLYVSHNLTAENLIHAQEIGGLAAPSIAISNIDKGGLTGFGEITLVADPELLNTRGMRAFDADVFSPRHPRATNKVDSDAFFELERQLRDNSAKTGGLRTPDIDGFASDGAAALAQSPAVQYEYLKSIGKAPAARKIKLAPGVRAMLKFKHASIYDLQADPGFIAAVVKYAGSDSRFFDEDGAVNHNVMSRLAYTVQNYHKSNGIDSIAIKALVRKRISAKATRRGFDAYVKELADKLISGKQLFRGYTPSGRERYVPYNMDTILKEMTGKIKGAEAGMATPGSLRAAFAKELKSIGAVKKEKDSLVSKEEMKAIREESSAKVMSVLDKLKPAYKWDADGFGYFSDAMEAISEGPRGWNEAFNLTPESKKNITGLVDYLKGLPTEYFEVKAQRAVGINEFAYAAVPRGTNKAAVDLLKQKGIDVRYYKASDAADLTRAVKGFKRALFSYAGSKAETADKGALQRATEMHGAKADMEEIRKETGWFLGPDDKWRFELSDEAMKFKPNPKVTPGAPGIPPHYKLDALLDHPKLFDAYPELAEYRVEVIPVAAKESGSFDEKGKVIAAKRVGPLSEFKRSTILHEVQHAIQGIEGFARGGSSVTAQGAIPNSMWKIAVRDLENRFGHLPFVSDLSSSFVQGDISQREYEMELISAANTKDNKGVRGYIFELYQRLAGEIEARDTAARLEYTENQRASEEPYIAQGIPRKKVVVAFTGGKAQEVVGDVAAVQAGLESAFGKTAIRAMIGKGELQIAESSAQFPGVNAPDNVQGLHIDGTIWINAATITDPAAGMAEAIFAHEVTHKTENVSDVLGVDADKLGKELADLRDRGDAAAMSAWDRIPSWVEGDDIQSEFIAYFVEEAHGRLAAGPGTSLSDQAAALYRRIIAAVRAWFIQTKAGNGFDIKPTDELMAALVLQAVGRQVDGGKGRAELKAQYSVAPEFGKSVHNQVQSRLEKAAKGAPRATISDKIKEGMETSWNEFTRAFPKLNKARYGAVLDVLRQWKGVPEYAHSVAFDKIYKFVGKMDDKARFVYTMNLVLPDMLKDIDSGLLEDGASLPFGYGSREEVVLDLENFKAQAETRSDIPAALKARDKYMKETKQRLVDAKLLKDEVLDDDAYYHHQVLDFMALGDKFTGTGSGDVRVKSKGWQKARTGSKRDYNLEYLESEFEVISQQVAQLEAKKNLDRIGKLEDVKAKLVEKAKAKNEAMLKARNAKGEKLVLQPGKATMKSLLGDDYVTWEDVLKTDEKYKGYVKWKPAPGTVWYHVNTVTDKILETAQQYGEVGVVEDDIKSAMAKGRDVEWAIPAELAETLDDPAQAPKENTIIGKSSAQMITKWKQWTLLNPFRVIKYNLNNTSGDLDIALAYDPRILKYTKKAAKDLWTQWRHPERLSPDTKAEMDQWLKLQATGSGFVVHDIDDFSKAFKEMMDPSPNFVKNYWMWTKGTTNFRENVLRLSAARYFKDRIDKGHENLYGASERAEVDAITDPKERAAKLARELIGDYGNISHAGQYIRRHVIPFWSWSEINAPRYVRLIKNLKHEGDSKGRVGGVLAWKGAKLGVKMAALSGLIQLYNTLVWPDEEEELTEAQRRQLHLILGRREDGSIRTLRIQGAFSDALSWFGGEDLPSDVSDLMKGKKTMGEYMGETLGATPSKLWQGAKPIEKTIAETVIGRTTWPDIMNPRPIRDRAEHMMRFVSMGMPYKHITGRPSRGFSSDMWSLLLYNADPGESAYYQIRSQMQDYQKKQGEEPRSFTPTSRGNALYYYKQALKFGDFDAAEKYREEYFNLGGTRQGMRVSVKRNRPISSLKKKYRRDFLRQLSAKDKKIYEMANKWYRDTYRTPRTYR